MLVFFLIVLCVCIFTILYSLYLCESFVLELAIVFISIVALYGVHYEETERIEDIQINSNAATCCCFYLDKCGK